MPKACTSTRRLPARAGPVTLRGRGARRQRHDNGNPQLVAQMARAFKVPDAKAATSSNAAQAGAFERFIYLSQARPARLPARRTPAARGRAARADRGAACRAAARGRRQPADVCGTDPSCAVRASSCKLRAPPRRKRWSLGGASARACAGADRGGCGARR